jgi:chromosome segregation ATPase
MDRYVDYLRKKLTGLNATITVLVGKKSKLDRNVASLQEKIEQNAKLGAAAIKQGLQNEASAYGVKVQTDRNTIGLLLPLQMRLNKSLDFLTALSENWKFGIEKLEYQIQGKRTEYEIIKEATKGLKNAEDFINSDNEAARIYGQSLKALEESVTQKIGYIEEFERKSKGLMSSISIEKQSIQDEGLRELEKYMKDGNLVLPDFSKLADGDLAYEMVKPKSHSGNTNEFNL